MLLEVFLVLGTLLIYFLFSKKDEETLPFKDGWWGRGQKPMTKEDSSIRPFKVETAEEELSVSKSLGWGGGKEEMAKQMQNLFGSNF